MRTKAKFGITKLKIYIVAVTDLPDLVNQIPQTVAQVLTCLHWKQAMNEEFVALQRNHTWSLVTPSDDSIVIGCNWNFSIKRHPNISIQKYKLG